MAVEQFSLLGSPFFTNIVMPFVLIFTVTFAILEKTQLLGKKRKDVNAIVALVFALVAIGVPTAMGVLATLIPVIAVLIIILFSWFLVFGFIGEQFETKWTEGMRKTFLVVIGVVILATIAWATGLYSFITLDDVLTARVMQIVLLVGTIIAIIAVVVGGDDKKEDK